MPKDKNIVELPVDELQPNPLQPRGMMNNESLGDLVNSIKEHGVLEPLVVAHTPAGYQIIAGGRRWKASQLAGLTKVPVVIRETSQQGMLEMAIVENVQREDLNPLERAKAFDRLIAEFGLSRKEISQRVAKSIAYVSNTLNLLNLPDALKDALISGMIAEGHARALLSIQDNKLMIEAFKTLLRESGSVRRAEEIARRIRVKVKKDKGINVDAHIIQEETDKMQEDLKNNLGEKAAVKLIRTERRTKLYIILSGSPKETEETLQKIYKGITS